MGGTVTALAVHIETYPTHIAGLPVAVNICCHVNRHVNGFYRIESRLEEIMDYHMNAPISTEDAGKLKAGDYVYLTGTIYTARDAAHKRMKESLDKKESLPFDIKGSVIYYMGPSPAREGRPIGSAGPTTASRMDRYTPQLLDLGLGVL